MRRDGGAKPPTDMGKITVRMEIPPPGWLAGFGHDLNEDGFNTLSKFDNIRARDFVDIDRVLDEIDDLLRFVITRLR